jgi:hypothetical protein
MADLIYNTFKQYMGDGTIDMDTHTFKCCLLTSSYTPSATHAVYADLSSQVASGGGYTTGGATLASVTWSRSGGTVTWDAADPSWTSATFTARYAVIYDDTPTSPADPLVCLIDFGSDQSVSAGTFTIQFHSSGILTLS